METGGKGKGKGGTLGLATRAFLLPALPRGGGEPSSAPPSRDLRFFGVRPCQQPGPVSAAGRGYNRLEDHAPGHSSVRTGVPSRVRARIGGR